ncbi:MAG: 7-carboxy-7-deazaguanine synthase QueE [Magnetococcales bacterium]|nr:7-carboxy-7-deazaguanine synthase QueE [Magnetococcales bacterium]
MMSNSIPVTYPVCELFASVQGEATWTGRPVIFIRFSGCPLACTWCDEPRHRNPALARHLSSDEIIQEIHQGFPDLKYLVLTGGEPLAVNELAPLVKKLKAHGFWIAMETSGVGGSIPEEIDWVTLSPKTDIAESIAKRVDEIKLIIGPQQDDEEQKHIQQWTATKQPVWLQPRSKGNRIDPEAVARCFEMVMNSAGRLRLSLQIHKYMGVQ